MDALGRPASVLVLGGTSEIGLATTRRLVADGARRVVLAGRDRARLEQAAATLPGDARVETAAFDALDTDAHGSLVEHVFAAGDVDVVLLAFGLLGDQARAEADPSHAVEVGRTNYVGALSAGLHVASALRRQGHGTVVVLSSVAGEVPRRANYVYGSSKAGLDAFARGLRHALAGSGARVLVVRPGFVRGRMTAHLSTPPLSTDPDAVAGAVASALQRARQTVYVPPALRWVMAVLRLAPAAVIRRLPR